MDALIPMTNAVCLALLSLGAGWAVLDPRINDGFVIKAGLILVCLGAAGLSAMFWMGAVRDAIERAALLLNVGEAIVVVGWYWRMRGAGHHQRRASDWMHHA